MMSWSWSLSLCLLTFSLTSVLAELPACFKDNESCDLRDSNLVDWFPADSLETCRQNCSTAGPGPSCSVVTYYSSESSPYQSVCLHLSSCLSTSPCQNCVTESQINCICSLPYQCYANSENILEILPHPLYSEQACKTICYDTRNCSTYNYYDPGHPSSPGLCVLLSHCSTLVPGPCQNCHLGPDRCSREGGRCRLALWSASHTSSLVVSDTISTTTATLLSGEPGCTREVRMLGVGGGGGTLVNRAGGGSGYVVFNTALVTANSRLEIAVGAGGERNQTGGASSISYSSDGSVLLAAEGGGAARLTDGGDGYSGGGAQGASGGTGGANGTDYGPNYKGGSGSGFALTQINFDLFSVSAGGFGQGDMAYGGGGGGGLVVEGPGVEDLPPSTPGEGEGWGGGSAGSSEVNNGLPGLVVMEINNDLITP